MRLNRYLPALFYCIILFYGFNSKSFSQNTDTTAQKDIGNYIKKIIKKPEHREVDTCNNNSRGPFPTVLPYPGYSSVSGFFFGVTNNISFYTLRTDSAKMSVILVSDQYSQNHQFVNIINSNIWTDNNRFNIVGDYSYSIFPTKTYGLGSTSLLSDAANVKYDHLRIYEVVMRKVSSNFYIGAGYDLDYHWNIKESKGDANPITDLERYGYNQKSTSSGFTLNMEYDSRLNSNNPENGTYAHLQFRNNAGVFGSDNNWKSLILDVRH